MSPEDITKTLEDKFHTTNDEMWPPHSPHYVLQTDLELNAHADPNPSPAQRKTTTKKKQIRTVVKLGVLHAVAHIERQSEAHTSMVIRGIQRVGEKSNCAPASERSDAVGSARDFESRNPRFDPGAVHIQRHLVFLGLIFDLLLMRLCWLFWDSFTLLLMTMW